MLEITVFEIADVYCIILFFIKGYVLGWIMIDGCLGPKINIDYLLQLNLSSHHISLDTTKKSTAPFPRIFALLLFYPRIKLGRVDGNERYQ